jgi:hypothetical protein
MLPATQRYIARGDIRNVKNSFSPFRGKAEIERGKNVKTYEQFIYGDIYMTFIHFVNMC